jgi:PTH1 family peptidyl-tRNA hydrolase
MWLLVGLGNPGSGYARNRHNVGFMALDEIAKHIGCGPWKAKFQGRLTEGRIGRQKVLLLKPETYMNLSGQSVGEALHFHKIEPENLIVFHDDLDLAAGKVRVKLGGGHGGHNGLRSLDAHIGPSYHRVRLGIGHPGAKELVHGYVLQDFAAEDTLWLKLLLKALGDNINLLLEGDEAGYMNKLALAVKPPKAKTENRTETT